MVEPEGITQKDLNFSEVERPKGEEYQDKLTKNIKFIREQFSTFVFTFSQTWLSTHFGSILAHL